MSKVANTIRFEHKATKNHRWVSKSSEKTGAKESSCRKGECIIVNLFFLINSENAVYEWIDTKSGSVFFSIFGK